MTSECLEYACASSWLMKGERVMLTENDIGYMAPPLGRKLLGNVAITNFRLRFESTSDHLTAAGNRSKKCIINLPLGCIEKIEKYGGKTMSRDDNSYGIKIDCKDIREIRLVGSPQNSGRRNLYMYLHKYAFPTISSELEFFAYDYNAQFPINGWSIYDPKKEFARLGVPTAEWCYTKINHDYEWADTYPAVLVIPTAIEDKNRQFLDAAGKFRSKRRIPVLTWLHPRTQASLTRCSQPMTGVTARRCTEDEEYLTAILNAGGNSTKLYIADARPEVNAKVNRAKGGGYEGEEAYPNCSLAFADIQNIHVMRESQRKLRELAYPNEPSSQFLTRLDDTHWLEYIRLLLAASAKVADRIEVQQESVLVHCSDGWDRTAQLCGLAQLLLDPYYRTIKGFAVLIEKDWCSFGHKFAQRLGHGSDKHGDTERSPVFLQFIDCVWQLTQQFPRAFEFNSHFLTTIVDEAYACRFGTFLYNNEKQRMIEPHSVRTRALSVWSIFFEDNKFTPVKAFVNPLFSIGERDYVLRCSAAHVHLKLWNDYYLRYNPYMAVPLMREERDRATQYMFFELEYLKAEIEKLRQEANTRRKLENAASTVNN